MSGKVYGIGGTAAGKYPNEGEAFEAVTTVEEYDPEVNSWTRKSSMPTARWGLALVVVNNTIYAIGAGGHLVSEPEVSHR